MKETLIENMKFHTVQPNKDNSLIGFCSFVYNGEIVFNEVAVHRLKNPKQYVKVRLVYPLNIRPINRKAQQVIDEEVNAYLLANFKNSMLGDSHD